MAECVREEAEQSPTARFGPERISPPSSVRASTTAVNFFPLRQHVQPLFLRRMNTPTLERPTAATFKPVRAAFLLSDRQRATALLAADKHAHPVHHSLSRAHHRHIGSKLTRARVRACSSVCARVRAHTRGYGSGSTQTVREHVGEDVLERAEVVLVSLRKKAQRMIISRGGTAAAFSIWVGVKCKHSNIKKI